MKLDEVLRLKLLKVLLRIGGSFMLLAVVAVLMPTAWMETVHNTLGIGQFPRAPLTEYLTRSISALYAVHGGLLWVISLHINECRPVIRYLGWSNIVFGVVVGGIDLHAGMPLIWFFSEGPPLVVTGLIILWLSSRSVASSA